MKSYKFTIQGTQYEVEIKSVEDTMAILEVNGTQYDVEIHRQVPVTKTPILVRNPVKPPETAKQLVTTAFLQVKTPLPGNILAISKKNGDKVSRGELVLTYEAMKMENKILAERDGVIRNLNVNAGDIILQDQVLFEIE
jgi:biotin carboxyl carrier protein